MLAHVKIGLTATPLR